MPLIKRFLEYRIDPFILGVFRISFGIYLIFYYLSLAPNWLNYYGPHSFSTEAVRPWSQFNWAHPSIFLHPIPTPGLWLFYSVCIAASVLLLFGLGGRIPIAWLWFANFTIAFRNFQALNSEEQVAAVLLFWCLFLPLEKTLSLRFRNGRWVFRRSSAPVRAWPLILFQIQFASIYLVSWPFKLLNDPAWWDGTVIYYALNNLAYSRFPGLALVQWHGAILSRIASYYTLFIELAFPLLVWFRPLRMKLTLGLMALHFAIGLSLNGVSMFNWTMLLGLLLFVPSEWARRLVLRFKLQIDRRSSPPAFRAVLARRF